MYKLSPVGWRSPTRPYVKRHYHTHFLTHTTTPTEVDSAYNKIPHLLIPTTY